MRVHDWSLARVRATRCAKLEGTRRAADGATRAGEDRPSTAGRRRRCWRSAIESDGSLNGGKIAHRMAQDGIDGA